MPTIQVLLSTVELNNVEELVRKSNIQTPFVIGNQCDVDDKKEVSVDELRGVIIERNERGVGNNRNITLKYSDADICIIADDDMCFHDGYSTVVEKVFEKIPDADVVIFNIENSGNGRRINNKTKKLNKFNYMNYGAARIAFKRKPIVYNAITFNTNFGGGTQHSAGEDVLFVGDCLKKKLNIYAVPISIATLCDNERESTWFKGYTDKYLFDKGVFLAVAHPKLSLLFATYLSIRHGEYVCKRKNKIAVLKEMLKGIRFIKNREYTK